MLSNASHLTVSQVDARQVLSLQTSLSILDHCALSSSMLGELYSLVNDEFALVCLSVQIGRRMSHLNKAYQLWIWGLSNKAAEIDASDLP